MKKLFLIVPLLFVASAFADQIFVCQSCTTPAGGDPNLITNSGSFNIGLAGGGHTTQTGLLVFVGVYNGTSATAAPTLTFNNASVGLSGLGDWGETAQQFMMVAGQDAYVDLGFLDINGGNSETFANWNLGEAKAGIAPATSFELFAFDVPTALTGNSSVVLDLTGAGKGSFVIAFSCGSKGPGAESGQPCLRGDIADTPFTNAGLITDQLLGAPEPSTLIMFGSGLLGLVPLLRRK